MVTDDMNESWLRSHDFDYYEQLKAMDEINNSRS